VGNLLCSPPLPTTNNLGEGKGQRETPCSCPHLLIKTRCCPQAWHEGQRNPAAAHARLMRRNRGGTVVAEAGVWSTVTFKMGAARSKGVNCLV